MREPEKCTIADMPPAATSHRRKSFGRRTGVTDLLRTLNVGDGLWFYTSGGETTNNLAGRISTLAGQASASRVFTTRRHPEKDDCVGIWRIK